MTIKLIFNIANGLLFRKQESVLPLTRPILVLAEDFSEFFQTKIDNIMEKLREETAVLDNKYIETNFQTNCRMNKFTLVFHSDVKEIVSSAPAKSCKLDPIPTSLLKEHIEVLAPIISNITNSSFKTGIFSDELNVTCNLTNCKKSTLVSILCSCMHIMGIICPNLCGIFM